MKLLVAGGGTGGHLFPGIAIAEELLTRQPNRNDVLFVGTARGIEARVVPQRGYKLELIEIAGLKGMGLLRALSTLARLPRAVLQAAKILRAFKPDVVVGVGGYASGPVLIAAFFLRIPTAVQEQNALPGLTNRVLAKVARRVFTAFPEATARLPKRKVSLLGNPIRRAFLDNYLSSDRPHDSFNLLIFGGSQGATVLNDAAIAAIPHLSPALRARLKVVHQTGSREVEKVRAGYEAAGVEARVLDFIDDMSGAYAEADAILCRAGATTLAEITVAKKAAVLVPFARAADNHQELNARSIVEAGAAVMVLERELSGERLAKELEELQARERRQRMERAAGRVGRPEAARDIVDALVELARPAGKA